jgi:cytochrome c
VKLAPMAAAMAAAAACAAPAPPENGPAIASAAELALGERIYRQCYACHALEPGRNTPAGPTLHAVVGRAVAAEPGFNYSPALRRLAQAEGRWTSDLLDRFLTDPAAVAPGTEMGYPGLADAAERRAVIAWLDRPTDSR